METPTRIYMKDVEKNVGNDLRHNITFGYLIIIIIFCISFIYIIFGPVSKNSLGEHEQALTSVAASGVFALEHAQSQDYQEFITGLVDNTDFRATLIDAQGSVLADSQFDPSTMENHANRPEVKTALSGETGSDTRPSSEDDEQRMYVAVPIQLTDGTGVLRVSQEMTSITADINSLHTISLIAMIATILLASVVLYYAYHLTAEPVDKLEKVRTDFVANASHELKTPTAGIRLLADSINIAADDNDTKYIKMFASRLDIEAQRLQSLVTDLIDLSRLENDDNNALRSGVVDLHSVISTAIESRRKLATSKNLKLEFVDATSEDEHVRVAMGSADASLIIDNLLDNAISYTESGGVTVILDCNASRAKLSVTDTGIGLDTSDIPRIFERFYRVDVARSRESGGTGLGLSLVRHAVLRAQGTIEVTSKPGEGSAFTVRLPRKKD